MYRPNNSYDNMCFRPKEVDIFCFFSQEGQPVWLLGTNSITVVDVMQQNIYIMYFKIKSNLSSLAFSCMVKSLDLPAQNIVDLHNVCYGLALKGTLPGKKDSMIG